MALVPAIGFVSAILGMRKGLRARRLLATGSLARGVLKSKERTNTRINNRTVYRLTFEYTAQDGLTYEAVAKSHLPHQLEDEEHEHLVYDPWNPSYTAMLDALPGRPRVNREGEFETDGAYDPLMALLSLVIPTVTLLGHGWYLLSIY